MLWKVSHDNCREVIVEAPTPGEARAAGLAKLGVNAATLLPVRVWSAENGETPESLAAKLKKQEAAKPAA